LARDVSFGGSISYWSGELVDDQFRSIDETGLPLFTDRLTTESDVDGFSFDLGVMAYAGKHARLGLALRSPVWLSIEGGGFFEHQEAGNDFVEDLFIADEPRLPWSAAAGGSLGNGFLLLTGEVRYTAWDEISGVPRSGGSGEPGVDPDYTGGWGGGAGVELALPKTPLRLRAGYSRDAQPYTLHLGNNSRLDPDRERIAAGAGLLIAGSFALDASYTWTRWTRYDVQFDPVSEQRDERAVPVAGAYRF
jgi:long-subunit fatty acid transport protein